MTPRSLRNLPRSVRQAADPNAVPAVLAGRYPANSPVNKPYRPRTTAARNGA
ncbi:hypothetical protein AB0B63_07250 [Micromonospora sp. NPDC049081]|uniref:hypothetical protein n=1 Tax=Micromonospora sp. NPDC049081 TaxID=3155150 RepID=UPI0033CB5563